MSYRPAYTIGTLVTDWGLYEQMRRSMRERGFGDDCEFLTIDNSVANQADAYAGLNDILNRASGRYVILCHQDVELVDDGRDRLDFCLQRLDALDPNWAIAGNAGGSGFKRFHYYLTDIFGERRGEGLPARVFTLDENFIVVKSDARLSFSRDLHGFHMYGPDICMVAGVLGWTAYVIPFHLLHRPGKGGSVASASFTDTKEAFVEKWRRALRHRPIQTTVTYALIVGENCPRWYARLKRRLLRWGAKGSP